MILLLAGTQDGRELGSFLQKRGLPIILSTMTEYGSIIGGNYGLHTRSGPLTKDDLKDFVTDNMIRYIVDATHPYATLISKEAIKAAEELEIGYIRYERPIETISPSPLINWVNSIEEAARLASSLSGKVLITTGSKELQMFVSSFNRPLDQLLVRVLPTPDVLLKCFDIGLKPENIIAIQGPFSKAFNLMLIKEKAIDIMVTKESGSIGGQVEKVEAALEAGICLIILKRPALSYPALTENFEEIYELITKEAY